MSSDTNPVSALLLPAKPPPAVLLLLPPWLAVLPRLLPRCWASRYSAASLSRVLPRRLSALEAARGWHGPSAGRSTQGRIRQGAMTIRPLHFCRESSAVLHAVPLNTVPTHIFHMLLHMPLDTKPHLRCGTAAMCCIAASSAPFPSSTSCCRLRMRASGAATPGSKLHGMWCSSGVSCCVTKGLQV